MIQKIVLPVLGPSALNIQGGTSTAGLRQAVGSDSLPVVFDEFETLKKIKENTKLLDLFRQSWSHTESMIAKGTPEGVATSYLPTFPVLVSGIRVHFETDADESCLLF